MKQKDTTCSFCGQKGCYARGLCEKCYNRKRRNGTPEYKGRKRGPEAWSYNTKKVLDLYKTGMRQRDIVKEVGMTRQAVSLVLKKYKKPTNGDRLCNNMEYMAKFLADLSGGDCPPNSPECEYCRLSGEPWKCWLDWLMQEAEE